jgi:hypothetical protein
MAGLAGEFQHQAIGEAEGRMRSEQGESGRHDIRVLQGQVFVIERHFNRPLFDEGVGGSGLVSVVPCEEAHEDVGVNGAHNARGPDAGSLLSWRQRFWASADAPGTTPDVRLRT